MQALRVREKVGYAFGDFASCLIWQTISIYLLFYFTNVAGVEQGAAMAIISASKIIDGLTDILMGFIIERTRTRFGKVRPYLLTMGLPLAVSLVMLFSVPASMGNHGKLIWIFVSYNMVTSVFYTALNVPYSGMHNFLTDDSMERSRLSILRLIFAYAAQTLINSITLLLVRGLGDGTETGQAGWTGAMIVIGTASFALALVTFFTTRERVGSSEDEAGRPSARAAMRSILRNRYLLLLLAAMLFSFTANALGSGAAAYYAESVLRDVDATAHLTNASTIAMVLGLIFIVPFVLKRFSKRAIYQTGIAAMALAGLLSSVAPDSLPLLVVMNAVKGLAMGATSSMIYAMFADAVDWGEYHTGIRTAGLGTGLLQCMGKFGIALGTALMGMVLAAGGYSAGAETQTDGGLAALIAVYTWIPGVILILSLGIMFGYTLDRYYPEVARKLRERREQNRNPAA